MDELLPISKRELTHLEVMQRIKDKRLTQKEAARMLSLSVRQIKRLYRAYKAQGTQGLVSRRRGAPGLAPVSPTCTHPPILPESPWRSFPVPRDEGKVLQ